MVCKVLHFEAQYALRLRSPVFCLLLSRMNTACEQVGVLIFIIWRKALMRRNR